MTGSTTKITVDVETTARGSETLELKPFHTTRRSSVDTQTFIDQINKLPKIGNSRES